MHQVVFEALPRTRSTVSYHPAAPIVSSISFLEKLSFRRLPPPKPDHISFRPLNLCPHRWPRVSRSPYALG